MSTSLPILPPSFPAFPTYTSSGGFTAFIIQFFIWLVRVCLFPFEYIAYGIADGFYIGFSGLITSLFGMASSTYSDTVAAFSSFGVLAPIIASFVLGLSIVILIFFAFVVVKMFTTFIKGQV